MDSLLLIRTHFPLVSIITDVFIDIIVHAFKFFSGLHVALRGCAERGSCSSDIASCLGILHQAAHVIQTSSVLTS